MKYMVTDTERKENFKSFFFNLTLLFYVIYFPKNNKILRNI